jgi:ribonuclease P protein component
LYTWFAVRYREKLSFLHPDAFVNFDPDFIDSSYDALLKTDVIQAINKVKHAMERNLLENKIESIPTATFNNLKRVHFINLRNNSIIHISSRAFEMKHEEEETGSYSAVKLNHYKLTY